MGVRRREVYKSVYSKAPLVHALGEEKAPRCSMQEERGIRQSESGEQREIRRAQGKSGTELGTGRWVASEQKNTREVGRNKS